MRVAAYYNNKDIRIEEKPVPKIGAGELLVKIRSSGICGSDVTEWYRIKKQGKVLGHEVSGEVIAVGAGVKNFKEGDRIAASHHVPCYECHYCRFGNHTLCDTLRTTNFDPGGFAEVMRLPEINVRYGVYSLQKNVTFEQGTFIEPMACTLRAQRRANLRPGQTLLVIGSGLAGLLQIHLARAMGIEKIIATDINDKRLAAAKEFGATDTFRADEDNLLEKVRATNEGRLTDVVIACASKGNANEQALQLVERGGVVLFFALHSTEQFLNLPLHEFFWQKGATLMNSYAASPEDHRDSLQIIQSGKVQVEKLISHRLPLAEIGKGFELVYKAQDSLKVIIDPTK
ncbi:MAG: alcohol dehydrogenase catalytic domain-containing protein [Deltaproteobacteria bacterium]|nr:alcohol dehydrogenase catalytic domain-containing protein [Deltaproteobacteria bacterium]